MFVVLYSVKIQQILTKSKQIAIFAVTNKGVPLMAEIIPSEPDTDNAGAGIV